MEELDVPAPKKIGRSPSTISFFDVCYGKVLEAIPGRMIHIDGLVDIIIRCMKIAQRNRAPHYLHGPEKKRLVTDLMEQLIESEYVDEAIKGAADKIKKIVPFAIDILKGSENKKISCVKKTQFKIEPHLKALNDAVKPDVDIIETLLKNIFDENYDGVLREAFDEVTAPIINSLIDYMARLFIGKDKIAAAKFRIFPCCFGK